MPATSCLFHFHPLATSLSHLWTLSTATFCKMWDSKHFNRFILKFSWNSKKSQSDYLNLTPSSFHFWFAWADSFKGQQLFFCPVSEVRNRAEYLHHRMFAHDRYYLPNCSKFFHCRCLFQFFFATAFVAFNLFRCFSQLQLQLRQLFQKMSIFDACMFRTVYVLLAIFSPKFVVINS